MFIKYVQASILTTIRHTFVGLGIALQTVSAYAEHALLQVCEDINNERAKRVGEDDPTPKLKLEPEDMN